MIGTTLAIVGSLCVVFLLGRSQGREQGYNLGTDDAVRYLRRRASNHANRAQGCSDIAIAFDLRQAAADLEDGNTEGLPQDGSSFLSLET